MKTAQIKRVTHGHMKGQYRFLLKAENGKIIATSETYTQKHSLLETLETNFPNFKIVE